MKYFINGWEESRSYFYSIGRFTDLEKEKLKNGDVVEKNENSFHIDLGDDNHLETYNIQFVNDLGKDDETQFDAHDYVELMRLFKDFCEENSFDPNKLTCIDKVICDEAS